ncbi:MAG: Hsp20/alpha crystallin family protein [Deltaproteobacteria bacterium]|uniref:Hsp20/alpha crystallin family protein n=1 Tax=Candidatus Zymogenus saltonus TaxID=2844893 RepID=A0A9D8PNS8_9DELT|nr:Hsp20/alpha crystallin family protein [Candidatus Zymogenus saltonus]
MALIRWDPFRDLLSLQDRMNRLFEESMTRNKVFEEALTTGVWSPVVDIYETDTSVILKAELPGMTKDDIIIEINENNLILKGERKFQKDIKEENYHRIERSYGTFSRSFTLPDTVDKDKVSASFKEGILEITIPKIEGAKPKQIEIQGE